MQKRIAVFISGLFHPALFPFYTSWILFVAGTNLQYFNLEWRFKVLLLIALGTIFLPGTLLPLIYNTRFLKSIIKDKGNERFFVLFLITLTYYLTFHFTRSLPLPALLQAVLLGATLTVFTLLLISVFYFISLHAAGIGGLIGILVALGFRTGVDFNLYILGSITLAGLIGYARMSLNENKPAEIYSGYLAGFLVNFLVMTFFP